MKVFIGIMFSLLSTGYAQQTIPSFVCNGVTPGTFVRDVTNCSGWIQCKGSEAPTSGKCPTIYVFDPVRQVCTTEGNVNCFTCPPGIATVAVENSCNRFIRCVGGVATEQICGEGLAYDQTVNNCNIGECGDGSNGSDGTTICPNDLVPGEYTATNSPTNCSIGFVCFGYATPDEVTCNQNLHFNTDTLMCVLPERSTCTVAGNTTSTTIPTTTSTTTTTTTTTTTPSSGPPIGRSSNFLSLLGSYSNFFS